MSNVLQLTDRDFEREVLRSNKPVLVDFWASWCPPCKMMESVIQQLSEESEDEVKVVKVNVDLNPECRTRYDIQGVPTIILFKDGKAMKRATGAQSRQQLLKMITV